MHFTHEYVLYKFTLNAQLIDLYFQLFFLLNKFLINEKRITT